MYISLLALLLDFREHGVRVPPRQETYTILLLLWFRFYGLTGAARGVAAAQRLRPLPVVFSLIEKNAGPVKALVASAHRVAHVLELLEEVFADILRYVVSLLHLVFFAALAALLRIKRYLV